VSSKSKRRRTDANAMPENARRVVSYVPRNLKQRDFLRSIRENDITFGVGAAGSGKTYLGTMAAIEGFEQGKYRNIVICRPAVTAGNERLGFLPGDLDEKMDPYMRPIWDAMLSYWSAKELHVLRLERMVEVIPYGFMRGMTFRQSFVLADEAQNSTLEQMYMLLTRLGDDSKMVITGDPSQTDIPTRTLDVTRNRLYDVPRIGWIDFGAEDVVRHPTVESVIRAWTAPNKE
jgi:phosphate starvation-inducible PhoH-like protein